MGLAASQARYLALTARKSDLEYQSQTINTRRIQLAYRTAEIAQAYSEGMNNRQFTTAKRNEDGNKIYVQATYQNILDEGYVVIPMAGYSWTQIDTNPPYNVSESPTEASTGAYTLSNISFENYTPTGSTTALNNITPALTAVGLNATSAANAIAEYFDVTRNASGTITKLTLKKDKPLTKAQITSLMGIEEADIPKFFTKQTGDNYILKNTITSAAHDIIKDKQANRNSSWFQEEKKSTYSISVNEATIKNNPNHAWDLQNSLETGRTQIITKAFYDYLMANGYDPFNSDTVSGTLFAQLQDEWKNNINDCNPNEDKAIYDWRADETDTFSQRSYTQDDAAVLAKYEAETADVQRQDKILELQVKNIETQHKAIETELEEVKKVIQQNIEKTFKIFS